MARNWLKTLLQLTTVLVFASLLHAALRPVEVLEEKVSASPWTERTSFRGLNFGATQQEVVQRLGKLRCENLTYAWLTKSGHAFVKCTPTEPSGALVLAGGAMNSEYTFMDSKLVSVGFDTGGRLDAPSYDTAMGAITERWGEPSRQYKERDDMGKIRIRAEWVGASVRAEASSDDRGAFLFALIETKEYQKTIDQARQTPTTPF